MINGNGATINLKNHNDKNEDHFLICDENVTVIINNLTITSFNTAIYNYGNMVLNNVTFKDNRLNYVVDFDVGGAIINNGFLTCINCSFINNYACFGGAIFSNGSSSKLNLTNCFFKDNVAYHKDGDNWFWKGVVAVNNYRNNKHDAIYKKGGNDVFVGGNGIAFVYHLDNSSTSNSRIDFGWDDIGHTIVLRNSFDPIVRNFVINDSASFQNVTSAIWNANTKVDVFIVNITGNLSINPWSNDLFYPRYGNLIINCDGGSVNVINPKLRSAFHFAFVNQFSTLTINNLTISGFNCAIYNYGVLNLNNVIFSNNRLRYVLEDCDAGAIYNLGLLNCYNCTFVNNSAKWGGAVYNAHGAQSYFTLCDFINNTNDNNDGANIYNFNHAKSFFVSENSNQSGRLINYGFLPSGKSYEFRKVMTYIIAFSIGAVVTALCPAGGGVIGVLVGTFVGTFVGTGLDVVNDMVYAKDTHHFSYSIFTNIPISTWNHFLFASVGASIGYSIRQGYDASLDSDSYRFKVIEKDVISEISDESSSELSNEINKSIELDGNNVNEIHNEIFNE